MTFVDTVKINRSMYIVLLRRYGGGTGVFGEFRSTLDSPKYLEEV